METLDLAGETRYSTKTCTSFYKTQDEFILLSILWNEARFDDYKQRYTFRDPCGTAGYTGVSDGADWGGDEELPGPGRTLSGDRAIADRSALLGSGQLWRLLDARDGLVGEE